MDSDTVLVRGIKELNAANSGPIRDRVRSRISTGVRMVDLDLSQTTFIDSCGLGALIALHKTALQHDGTVRLLNPSPPVEQVLELTRLHRMFEIVKQ